MIGAGLAIGLYLYRTMTPRVAILGRHPDGTLRDAKVHNLPPRRWSPRCASTAASTSPTWPTSRTPSSRPWPAIPKAPYLLVVGDGINELDASGEEVMHHIVERLRGNGVTVVFSGLKKQVIDVMRPPACSTSSAERHSSPPPTWRSSNLLARAGRDRPPSPLALPAKRFG
jgi:SulP family sulfate permease